LKEDEQWLVAVTAGRWQRHGIKEARSAGLKILAIDTDPDAEGFLDADEALAIDFSDHVKVIQELKNFNRNICGAVSFCSEAGMMLAANIREAFNLPGPRAELCHRLIDKAVQRAVWQERGLPCPEWKVFKDKNQALKGLLDFDFPVIIKPTDSSGSRGVTKIESLAEDLNGAVEKAFEFSRSGEVIIEKFMDGTEFTVETFGVHGTIYVLAITEKKKVEGTKGTVASELATAESNNHVLSNISSTVVKAFEALGYIEGPGHAEVILGSDGTVGLVEVAGRGGGFMVFDRFVPIVSGTNIARLTALQAVGRPVDKPTTLNKAAVLRFFPSRSGIVRRISGFEEADQIVGVEAGPFVKVGDHVNRASADGDRLGYILSQASAVPQALELADQAERLISFDIESQNDH